MDGAISTYVSLTKALLQRMERKDSEMTKLTPPLKWHGGKHYLAEKIIKLMPPHTHYVEPYFGGGAVLLAKNPEGVSEVVNDLNYRLMAFWDSLQDPFLFSYLRRRVEATPFSQKSFEEANKILLGSYPSWWDKAWAFFVVCRQSLAGRMDSFAPLSRTRTRRGMNEQASAWLNAIEGLPAVHERMKRVVILNEEAVDVIRQQDGKDTLFYCDPPYLHETRSTTGEFEYEMTDDQHTELLHTLGGIKGKFLLSGYRSKLYDTWAKSCKWKRRDFDLPNNSASGKKKERKTECVWTNY